VCVCTRRRREMKRRKEEKITVGERGKNPPQREKGGTAFEKRRDDGRE